MPKNITIKQDGTDLTYSNISIIGTRADFGSGDWIPKDESNTRWKYITKNGRYIAKERDGVKGYTAVFVYVPLQKIVGKDRNDGHTYEVCDDGSGNLIRTQID